MDKKELKNRIAPKNFRWLLSQYRPHRWKIAGLVLLQCIVSLLGVASVVVNKFLVDSATADSSLSAGIAVMIGATVLSVLINLFVQMWMITFQEKCSFSIRTDVYGKILRSRLQAVKQFHSEDMLTRLTSDVEQVSGGILHIVIHGIGTFVKLVSAFLLLCYYDVRLAVAVIVIAPIGVCMFMLLSGKMRHIQENYQKSEANYRVYLQESLRNLPVIKAFSGEGASEAGLDRLRDERMAWAVKKRQLRTATSALIHITFTVGTTLAFLFGVVQIAEGKITYGTMTAFLSLVSQIQNPVMSLGEMLRRLISVLASVPRIMELEVLPRDEAGGDTEAAAGPVEIRGEHIAFAYDKEAIFEDFSFRIGEGEVVAVTGHSGAGKTTLIKLLLGFAAPDAGELCLREGERELPITAATRNYFSYVPQGNTLFHGTIRENLQMGNPAATEEELWEALEIACAREFVEKLPQGLNTMLGEQSSGISEGQAQRIAIARAMLRRAPVVIFDEATSALDEATELHILEHIRNKGKDTTYLIITHRQKALEYCTSRITIG